MDNLGNATYLTAFSCIGEGPSFRRRTLSWIEINLLRDYDRLNLGPAQLSFVRLIFRSARVINSNLFATFRQILERGETLWQKAS